MNSDKPLTPREQVEVRLTALLLGEVPAEEAAALQNVMAGDAELSSLYRQLERAIALVREASAIPEEAARAAALKLSGERREKLLAHFKTVSVPQAAAPRRRRDWWSLAQFGVAAALIAFVGGSLLLPQSGRVYEHAGKQGVRQFSETERRSVMERAISDEPVPSSSPAVPAQASAVWDRGISKQMDGAFLERSSTGRPSDPLSESAPTTSPAPPLAQALADNPVAAGEGISSTAALGNARGAYAIILPSAASSDFNAAGGGGFGGSTSRGDLAAVTKPLYHATDELIFTAPTPTSDLASAIAPTEESGLGFVRDAAGAPASGPPPPPAEASKHLAFDTASEGTFWDTPQKKQEELFAPGDGLERNRFYRFGSNKPVTSGGFAAGQGGTENGRAKRSGGRELQVAQLEQTKQLTDNLQKLKELPAGGVDAKGMKDKMGQSDSDSRLWAAPNFGNVRDEANIRVLGLEGMAPDERIPYYRGRGTNEAGVSELSEEKNLPALAKKPAEVAKEDEGERESVSKKLAEEDRPARPAVQAAPEPQPEIQTSENAFSTFSLNVTDVAFKLAGASLDQGTMPEPASLRSEEFINAFDYRDSGPAAGVPLAFTSERARYPFAHNRDLVRLSVKTAASGRQPGRALNLVLLLDNSGSMERADRVRIRREALTTLAAQLQPQDKLSVITFARTAQLGTDGVAGDHAGKAVARVNEITPEGGTNLAEALDLGYQTALKHYQAGSINRVVLLTDGAANLGDVDPMALKQKVDAHRKQGIALDCFGIGWEGLNDDLLEVLSRNGDGRYGFINTPEQAAAEFASQLAGALRVAASDVKVQVEFNPRRVTAYRQIGYAKHQLTKEQFRDNTVDAAEIGAAESGNALYLVEVNPRGEGDLGTVRVRFKVPGTADYREHEWTVPFNNNAGPLEQASPALRLAATAGAFAEWLASSPYAGEVTPDRLLGYLNGVPEIYGADPRPKKLEAMIRQAKSLSGR